MNKYFYKYISRFVLIVSIQVLLLNSIFFIGYINPYAYILFIILGIMSLSKNIEIIYTYGNPDGMDK